MSMEAVKAPPVPGVQKPPRRVGKRFRDCHVVAPEKKKVKRLAGLRMRPAWLRRRGLPGVASTAVQALRQLRVTQLGWGRRSGVRRAELRRGRRRVAEEVEPGHPDGPR
jgi:hypothetical protein